eukprot:1190123-Prorocentrum_minimum.AAC.2
MPRARARPARPPQPGHVLRQRAELLRPHGPPQEGRQEPGARPPQSLGGARRGHGPRLPGAQDCCDSDSSRLLVSNVRYYRMPTKQKRGGKQASKKLGDYLRYTARSDPSEIQYQTVHPYTIMAFYGCSWLYRAPSDEYPHGARSYASYNFIR